ncbi:MAG TPA: hypothetical protein VD884_20150, partial [Ohtaekwangia sp.]|nr:hypothetical protein [Ohtaekwangia sp.]
RYQLSIIQRTFCRPFWQQPMVSNLEEDRSPLTIFFQSLQALPSDSPIPFSFWECKGNSSSLSFQLLC